MKVKLLILLFTELCINSLIKKSLILLRLSALTTFSKMFANLNLQMQRLKLQSNRWFFLRMTDLLFLWNIRVQISLTIIQLVTNLPTLFLLEEALVKFMKHLSNLPWITFASISMCLSLRTQILKIVVSSTVAKTEKNALFSLLSKTMLVVILSIQKIVI